MRLARCRGDGKVVVAKMATSPSYAESLVQEWSVLRRLQHPNVAGLVDVLLQGSDLVVVLEDGGTGVDKLARAGQLDDVARSAIVDATAPSVASASPARDGGEARGGGKGGVPV